MGPKGSDGGFSPSFVQEFQWAVWNQAWFKANLYLCSRTSTGARQKDANDNGGRARKHFTAAIGCEEMPEAVIEMIRNMAGVAGEEAAKAHLKKEGVRLSALDGQECPVDADRDLWSRLLSAVHMVAVCVREGLVDNRSNATFKQLEDEFLQSMQMLSCPRWHIRTLKDMGEIGRALFACAPLYSHVQYFARLAQWLTSRGHKVRLVTVAAEPARKAAMQARLPEGTLQLLPEKGMSSGFFDIWNELSLQGTVSTVAEAKWDKSVNFLQTAATKVVEEFKPDLVVSDGMYNQDFVECCKTHARRAAVLTCHARKDGVLDDHGPERLPTLYPTVKALFNEKQVYKTTVLCGPFLPIFLRKAAVLREGSDSLRTWVEADDRPLIYVSFGTVAALKQDFIARFARALIDLCRGPPLRVGTAEGDQALSEPELREGDEVRIFGILKKAELNGKRGTLLSFNESGGRWTVKLENGEFAIKPDNLEFVGQSWLQLQETWVDSEEFIDGGKCRGTAAELKSCRTRCRERGYRGFTLSEGAVYYFHNHKTEELLDHADASPSSVFHFAVPAPRVPREAPEAAHEPPPAPAQEHPQQARWECPDCAEPNNAERQVCNSCGRARPSVEAPPPATQDPGAAASKADDTANLREPWCKVLWALPKEHQKLLPVQVQASRQFFRVEEFVPQQAVLRLKRTALCISHCGANSTHESLACGVPMLCVPFFRDQYDWCRAVVRRSAGIPLNCRSCTEDEIQEAAALALSAACAKGARELSKSILEHLDGKTGLACAAHFCLLGMLNQG